MYYIDYYYKFVTTATYDKRKKQWIGDDYEDIIPEEDLFSDKKVAEKELLNFLEYKLTELKEEAESTQNLINQLK